MLKYHIVGPYTVENDKAILGIKRGNVNHTGFPAVNQTAKKIFCMVMGTGRRANQQSGV